MEFIIIVSILALIIAANATLIFQIVFIQGHIKLMTQVITERMVASERLLSEAEKQTGGWIEEKPTELTRFHIPSVLRSID